MDQDKKDKKLQKDKVITKLEHVRSLKEDILHLFHIISLFHYKINKNTNIS